MKKLRIDELLIARNLAESLEKARALIMSGAVLANEQRVEKPSDKIQQEAHIRLKHNPDAKKYVGRGGFKLEKALSYFHIRVNACVCLDIGASTGGFTDCLLQNGADKVFAIDAGTNQLDWKLRNDPRVESRENTNARFLTAGDFPQKFDLVVMDVSFISVKKLFPPIVSLLKETGKLIVLIKPQFEVKRSEVAAGGIVIDEEKQQRVIAEINQTATDINLKLGGVIESPILGAEGNKEFLALYER